MKASLLRIGFFPRRSSFWMGTSLEMPIEKDIESIKREVAEIKKELNALVARLTCRKSYRDPRITFPRPPSPPLST